MSQKAVKEIVDTNGGIFYPEMNDDINYYVTDKVGSKGYFVAMTGLLNE